MTVYNYDELLHRFPTMTFGEILQEYANVQREILKTNRLPYGDELLVKIEPLQEAEHYLGEYIAISCCEDHGIKIFS